nr:uncharacterized protein LOC109406415 [Aedes albopictus]
MSIYDIPAISRRLEQQGGCLVDNYGSDEDHRYQYFISTDGGSSNAHRTVHYPATFCLSKFAAYLHVYFLKLPVVPLTLPFYVLRMKLRMLAHRFERITEVPAIYEDEYFDHVNWEVRHALLQHLEYWKYLEILKDLVGKVFLLVHYFSIFAIGAMFYVCREVRISFMTVIYIAGLAFSLSEYFLLCYLIDSLQDEADSLEQHIFEICALVPFRPERRSEYVQWQTTLMIIWINTRNGMSMWCSGLFEINTSQFVAVLNIAYSMLTFLLQMG